MLSIVEDLAKSKRSSLFQRFGLLCVLFVLLVIPLALSNHPAGTALSGMVFVFFFFFRGYLLLVASGTVRQGIDFVISPVVGIVCLTTL